MADARDIIRDVACGNMPCAGCATEGSLGQCEHVAVTVLRALEAAGMKIVPIAQAGDAPPAPGLSPASPVEPLRVSPVPASIPIAVLVCGGRDFTDYLTFARRMVEIERERGPFRTVIHGGAKGADWCAHLWAGSPKGRREERIFSADWKTHGRAAGPIRNQRMIDEGRPDLVIAFPGGRGTADMVRRARAAGIEVRQVAQAIEAGGGDPQGLRAEHESAVGRLADAPKDSGGLS